LRKAAPARTLIPAMSWGNSDFSVDEETEALIRELGKA
jgi:hypothetical protein